MKCIKIPVREFGTVGDTGMVVRRVEDDVAANQVRHGGWEYATRKEWKLAGRKWGLGKK